MSVDRYVTKAIIRSIVNHTCLYFKNEIHMTVVPGEPFGGDIKKLVVRDVVALISLGAPVNLLIAFSFDKSLVTAMFEATTAGLQVAEDEVDMFMRESAAEVINVVLGHSTADLTKAGKNVALSPPIVIEDASNVYKPKGAYFTTVTISTNKGNFDIDFIAPKSVFGA